jgi:hypothetical protein
MFGSKFKFNPESGVLKVGASIRIEVQFNSDILGHFYEEFYWKLQVGLAARLFLLLD